MDFNIFDYLCEGLKYTIRIINANYSGRKMDANERDMKEMVYNIIGAAMAVHRELGKGFLEPVYQEALALEFGLRNIPFEREKKIDVIYKGFKLNQFYKADFVCYGSIILELKAVSSLLREHEAQVLNYLQATKIKKGILINFGEKSLKYKTFVYSNQRRAEPE